MKEKSLCTALCEAISKCRFRISEEELRKRTSEENSEYDNRRCEPFLRIRDKEEFEDDIGQYMMECSVEDYLRA